MYVWLIPGDISETDEWCLRHGYAKYAVRLTSLSDTGVNDNAGTITFCHACQDAAERS